MHGPSFKRAIAKEQKSISAISKSEHHTDHLHYVHIYTVSQHPVTPLVTVYPTCPQDTWIVGQCVIQKVYCKGKAKYISTISKSECDIHYLPYVHIFSLHSLYILSHLCDFILVEMCGCVTMNGGG